MIEVGDLVKINPGVIGYKERQGEVIQDLGDKAIVRFKMIGEYVLEKEYLIEI